MADLLPGKDLVLGQNAGVTHGVVGVVHGVLIHIVAQQQVHGLGHGGKFPQFGHDLLQGIGVQPVVGIHHLEIQAGSIADALVDALAVVHSPADGGVFSGPGARNGAGPVLGTLIHQDDLCILARRQQGLDAAVHIGGGIITGHGKGDQFHDDFSSLLTLCFVPASRASVRTGCRPSAAVGARHRRCRHPIRLPYTTPVFGRWPVPWGNLQTP